MDHQKTHKNTPSYWQLKQQQGYPFICQFSEGGNNGGCPVEKYLVPGKTFMQLQDMAWHGLDVLEGQLDMYIQILNIFIFIATVKLLTGICHR